jgi:hypothetical protein
MFGLFFSLLVLIALSSICIELVMRVRLTKAETSRDKLVWWRRGGDEIAATYQELFPRSKLPLFREFAFWFLLGSAAVVVVCIFWKKH